MLTLVKKLPVSLPETELFSAFAAHINFTLERKYNGYIRIFGIYLTG